MVDFPNEIRINPAAINKLIIGGVVVVLVGIGVYAGPLCVAHALFAVYWYDERRKADS